MYGVCRKTVLRFLLLASHLVQKVCRYDQTVFSRCGGEEFHQISIRKGSECN